MPALSQSVKLVAAAVAVVVGGGCGGGHNSHHHNSSSSSDSSSNSSSNSISSRYSGFGEYLDHCIMCRSHMVLNEMRSHLCTMN